MRQSSNIKYEIIRDIHGLDPSHVESGVTLPSLPTFFGYCRLFNRCPGWVLLLSCQVDDGNLTEAEFLEMVKNWETYNSMAEIKIEEFVKMARKGIKSQAL
ncbi:MAG: hypothetical protein WC865_10790 [Bacteroidales bacterium]